MKKAWMFTGVFLVYLTSCALSEQKPAEKPRAEDFDSFYKAFHTDTLFQKKRVVFPLAGFSYEVTATKDSCFIINLGGEKRSFHVNSEWDRATWMVHHLLTDTLQYKREDIRDSATVYERIYIPASEFQAERVFRCILDKWFLVYYADNIY